MKPFRWVGCHDIHLCAGIAAADEFWTDIQQMRSSRPPNVTPDHEPRFKFPGRSPNRPCVYNQSRHRFTGKHPWGSSRCLQSEGFRWQPSHSRIGYCMKTTRTEPEQRERQLPALTAKDSRVSETMGAHDSANFPHTGINTTIGPSQLPANATLPPSEPVVPGKGRSPR